MGKKLLVVEDDELIREMIALVLEAAEYEVVGAENGFAALSKLGNDNTFNAVISDMNMPDITGLELMEQVHETLPDMSFIILTGESNQEIIQSALTQGAKACIIKSETFDTEILDVLSQFDFN
ncbi:response regulator [Pelosinus sp. sgz500959]|uniref:response regulator n=1 Tax=Pelosinus sp. sgz500959 TaxID=3242472 RepID=UPI00366C3DE3